MSAKPTPLSRSWVPRWIAVAVLAASAASGAAWLRLAETATASAPAAPGPQLRALLDTPAVARVLGAGISPPRETTAPNVGSAAPRLRLTGVLAHPTHQGTALIVVEDQLAKPFRVGSRVTEGLWLQSVSPRSAALATVLPGPVALTLELPAHPISAHPGLTPLPGAAPPATLPTLPAPAHFDSGDDPNRHQGQDAAGRR